LFFTKGEPTLNTWFYELNVGRNMGKTNPLNDKDLKEFVDLQIVAVSNNKADKEKGETDKSWSLPISDIDQATYDLSVKNPNTEEAAPLREPKVIIDDIIALDKESEAILAKIQELL
jgi:type I restriction enzyme M protein